MKNYAKIDNGVCVNTAVFDDEQTAIDFGYPILLPDGYGIGSLYDGEKWSYPPISEPEPEPEPEPTPDPIEKLEQENALLKQQVQALTEQAAFHEEIFVELAEVIYA